MTGGARIAGFIGGCHLTGDIFDQLIEPTVAGFTAAGIGHIVPGDCSGWRAVHTLAQAMPDAFVQSAVGTVVSF